MDNLDKLIHDNRDQFDATEPLDGHFERFAEKMGFPEQTAVAVPSRFGLLKVAAIILVIITGSIAVFDLATRSIRERFSSDKAGVEMSDEFSEAIRSPGLWRR